MSFYDRATGGCAIALLATLAAVLVPLLTAGTVVVR